MSIQKNLNHIRQNIEDALKSSPINTNSVTLLAVSKAQKINHIQEAFDAGQKVFAESYVQEALPKILALQHCAIDWHFIGPIQSNKTKDIANMFSWVQSIDREKILRRLNEQRSIDLPPLKILLQLNLFDEPQKQGFNHKSLESILPTLNDMQRLEFKGIMVIPPPQEHYQDQLNQFKTVYDIFLNLKSSFPTVDTLSMGMSSDMVAAIHAGSNLVRVGTGIFGPRPPGWKNKILNQSK